MNEVEIQSVKVAEEWGRRRREIEAIKLPSNLQELVEDAASNFGDSVAWNFFEMDEQYTFREVASLARRAANTLVSKGVRKGDAVAVMLPNSPLYLATWLGLAYLGGIIVPLNGRYTIREIEHVLNISKAKFLVGGDRLEEIRRELQSAYLEEEKTIQAFGEGAETIEGSIAIANENFCPTETVGKNDIVNIQFTSGTTGFPKGCYLSQKYWLNAAILWPEYLGRPIKRFLCNQNLFYLDGQFNSIVNLNAGTTMYYCQTPSVSKFDGWLRKYKIESLFYFDPLYAAEPQGSPEDYSLKVIHIFGFNPKRHSMLQERYPGAVVRESYGMSEYAPATLMPMNADHMNGSGSCGLPAPHTEIRIVDEEGQDVEAGQSGELLLKGEGMMSGYASNPEETAKTIKDGWLYTGDLFQQDEYGFLYVVGRKKDMIRRNSENVACIEVESILRLHPEVLEAITVPVPDERVGEEIKAYLLLKSSPVDPQDILVFCASHLASFKIPRFVEFVSEFPMTESSRVEKKKFLAGITDLRANSYDAETKSWITPPQPTAPNSIEDFFTKVGETYVGDWVKIEPGRHELFWKGTYLDRRYGETLGPGYPEGLIEGFFTLSLLDDMTAELVGAWDGFNYGLDRVRFPSNLTSDKRIRLVLQISEVTSKPTGVLVKYEAKIEIEEADKPAMVASWLVLLQDLQD